MIAGIRKARRGLEQDFELEQDVLLVLDIQRLEPLITGRSLLLTQRTGAAQEFVNSDLGRKHAGARALGDKHNRNFSPKPASLASPDDHFREKLRPRPFATSRKQ